MKTKKQIMPSEDRIFFKTIFAIIFILLAILLFLKFLDNEECSEKDIENGLCECVKNVSQCERKGMKILDEQGNDVQVDYDYKDRNYTYGCIINGKFKTIEKSFICNKFQKKSQCQLYIEGKENKIKDFDEECACEREKVYGSYSYFLNDGTGSGRNFNNDVLAISEQEYDEHLEYIDGLAKKGLLKEQYENIEYIKCIKARPKTFQDLNCKELQESYEWILETGHSGICEPFEQGFLCNIKYDKADILKRQLELGCYK